MQKAKINRRQNVEKEISNELKWKERQRKYAQVEDLEKRVQFYKKLDNLHTEEN